MPAMHDFRLTDQYVVLLDLPVTYSLAAAAARLKMPYTWDPLYQARVGLVPRDGGPGGIRWVEIEPCYVFHVLNAYDDGGSVVVDVCRYEGAYDMSVFTGKGPITLDRWIIDPGSGKITQQRLDDCA